jgi:hypothetical protein
MGGRAALGALAHRVILEPALLAKQLMQPGLRSSDLNLDDANRNKVFALRAIAAEVPCLKNHRRLL